MQRRASRATNHRSTRPSHARPRCRRPEHCGTFRPDGPAPALAVEGPQVLFGVIASAQLPPVPVPVSNKMSPKIGGLRSCALVRASQELCSSLAQLRPGRPSQLRQREPRRKLLVRLPLGSSLRSGARRQHRHRGCKLTQPLARREARQAPRRLDTLQKQHQCPLRRVHGRA